MDRKRRTLAVIHQRRDSPIRIQPQKPFLLLHVRANIDQRRRPLGPIRILQFLQQDLHRLSVGRGLRDEMQALGVLDVVRGRVDVEFVGHICAVVRLFCEVVGVRVPSVCLYVSEC